MTSPQTPNKYQGPDVYLANYVIRNRRPTGADYRQPETGRLYSIFCGWQVGKDPVNGTEGELWLLTKIVANVAFWEMISGAGGTVTALRGDDGIQVNPAPDGVIDVIGAIVPFGTHLYPIWTRQGVFNLNSEVWDIQIATTVAPTPGDELNTGVSCFNENQFTINPLSGMVSLIGSTVNGPILTITGDDGIPTSPDAGGDLQLLTVVVGNGTNPSPIYTSHVAPNIETIEYQIAATVAPTPADPNFSGIACYNQNHFTIDATSGMVSLVGGGAGGPVLSIAGNDGVPVLPDGFGNIDVIGATVANGTNPLPLYTLSLAANIERVEIQVAAAVAATPVNSNDAGIASFDNTQFTVNANGFVQIIGGPLLDLHTARYIVSAGGNTDGANFTDISSAITAAVLAGGVQTIFIQPGTYTENFDLPANINLTAYTADGDTPNVNIIGVITCLGTGTRCVSGLRVTSSGSCFIVTGAAAVRLIVRNCYLDAAVGRVLTGNTTVLSDATFYDCIASQDDVATNFFDLTTACNIGIFNCRFFSSSTVTSKVRNGCNLAMGWSTFAGPIETSGASTLGVSYSQVGAAVTALTLAGTNAHIVEHSDIGGPAAVTAISIAAGCILRIQDCLVAAQTPVAIGGAGAVQYSDLTFASNATSTIATTTQTPITISNDAVQVVVPGGYPYTANGQDAVIAVDTSAARTINLPAAPSTGEKHTVKDVVGSANANNITVQGNGSNINGAASETMNVNYQASTYVYTGTIWAKI